MANNVQLMTIIYSCYDHIKKAKNFSFINGDYERCTVKCLYNIPPLQNQILFFPNEGFPLYLSLHLKTKEQEAFYYAKYNGEQK